MEIHGWVSHSRVNGPGDRAVVWFQGCSLNCAGCWNPETHATAVKPQRTVEEVGNWILSCAGIDGVTFSGGEPFQQAADLLTLCEFIKRKRAGLSLGLFSGYTQVELAQGRWIYRHGAQSDIPGDPALYERIVCYLDFAVFGRFAQTKSCHDKPLCGSRNQQVVFFSDRYRASDLSPQACEILISGDGDEMTLTGFPAPQLIQILRAS